MFGFIQNKDETCVYKNEQGGTITLLLYVDDILLIVNDVGMLLTTKLWLSNKFFMKYLGEASYILSLKLYREMSNRLCDASKPMGPVDHRQLTKTCVSHIMRPIHE